jgi:hypothetical protein
MASKKTSRLKSLPKKAVNAKQAAAVKGGRAKLPRISLNHNQTVRAGR